MPQALTVLWAVLKSDLSDKDKKATALSLDKVLGLSLDVIYNTVQSIPMSVINIALLRQQTRVNQDWIQSDLLRDKINQLGYLVEDKKGGYILSKK
ncbi:hypothetical protein CJF42_05160 [Pseudoalteromonas sp. NBT06-2]|uniref:hypothetical protein n=1 Tax=Pseudoalteromonas sp. NBT06-2 TaxID=2025950 RepID=UPI000BA7A7AD|nr:hypothetical protein [Pseudoalteromonas sp. NBT06-2]PAJ75361.1 hypothetical protein CJF42_05160 [Pseudoalteromonas sp. NBT06-2]